MNTPSKEALEAAKELVYSYDPKAHEAGARAIDRHFGPLRQRAEQAEARVKELEDQIAAADEGDMQIRDENAALRAANAALAGALRDARASFLGLQPDFGGPVAAQMGKAIERIGAALSRHAAGKPAKHPDTERLEVIEDGGLDVFESDGEWYVGAAKPCRTLRAAIDAARQEVQS